jgi:hypothetical protein
VCLFFLQGWAQVLLFASALEVLAPQKEDKIPGDVQVRAIVLLDALSFVLSSGWAI